MSWDESRPRRSDLVRDFGLVVRSHKTELRAGLEDHFYWTDSSAASAGEPRYAAGSTATGTARAFYDTESRVSAFRDGSLFITSDTTRLYGLTSVSSVLLGSSRAVHNPLTGPAADIRVLIQSDETTVGVSDGTANVSFPIEYEMPPSVMVGLRFSADNSGGNIGLSSITAGGFVATVERSIAGNPAIWWRSNGTTDIV